MELSTDLSNIGRLSANTIRLLAADGVQKANSGHPGMPMGMADCAYVLWTRFLKFNPRDPQWPGRDRFILSAGHGSMLLYSLLHLSGYGVSIDDLKSFRQWNSRTPGHPEYGGLPGVETTTGPLGQGFANGIGMAIAAKIAAENFNTGGAPLFGSHHVYAIVSDGDLMEGVSSEAASLAGHLKLGNIIYIYDDNKITIEGKTDLAFTENVARRFEAYGWQTIAVDGHNHDAIEAAIEKGIQETGKPTLILARTHIGCGSPHKHDTSEIHGAPMGPEELRETKTALGFPPDADFYVPEEVQKHFGERVQALTAEYEKWQQQFMAWRQKNPQLAEKWEAARDRKVPADIEKHLLETLKDQSGATRSLSGRVMQKIAELVPSFYGGSADLAPSTNTFMKKYPAISADSYAGRNFHFGVREHGMGGILNGLALYGGFIPFGATFFVFSDYMRPTLRLAAISGLQAVYVFTHDSIFVGEDGPTHQPVEQLAALRAIPNLTVIRPADGLETAMAWGYALKNQDAPTALILTRQKVAELKRAENFDPYLVQKGGYVLSPEKNGPPEVVIVATGSEVQVAVQCQQMLEDKGIAARVVSMPSIEIFKAQDRAYRDSVLARGKSRYVVMEAGIAQGWGDLIRDDYLMIGMDRYGASGPYTILAEQFGFTAEKAAGRIMSWLETGNPVAKDE